VAQRVQNDRALLARLDAALESQNELIARLTKHLKPIGSGKVRFLFEVPGRPDLMAVFVSDNWSARDFVFGFVIPDKGKYLNISTIAVKRVLRKKGIKTDLIAYGRHVDEYLPLALQGDRELWDRLTIVKKCKMVPRELVYRNNLFGSALKDYLKPERRRLVCGQRLPKGMTRFDEFEMPFATPTTKAKKGHDVAVTLQSVEKRYPGLIEAGTKVVNAIKDMLAEDGFGWLVDIKLEMGVDADGDFVLCDEVSSDSSRLCSLDEYRALKPGSIPTFFDKEFGRTWADGRGIDTLNPANDNDCEEVRSWRPDAAFLEELLKRYKKGFFILARGHALEEYKKMAMSLP
jgi:phosphoribosylaminoimidazole-succinocarboxamide synthase